MYEVTIPVVFQLNQKPTQDETEYLWLTLMDALQAQAGFKENELPEFFKAWIVTASIEPPKVDRVSD